MPHRLFIFKCLVFICVICDISFHICGTPKYPHINHYPKVGSGVDHSVGVPPFPVPRPET